jgi:hypothetical protein
MALADRARRIITAPAFEWPVIAAEPDTAPHLFTSYVIPLAAIAPVCSFISSALFLHRPVLGAISAALAFVFALINVFVISLIASALAPSNGGVTDRMQALKLVAYSFTPGWVAGVLLLVPFLGSLITLLASLYGLYLIYLGATPVLSVPRSNAIGFTVLVVLAAIVLSVIFGIVVGLPLVLGGALLHGALH